MIEQDQNKELNILWTSDNKETVKNMIAMYAINALRNEWWSEINIIIWGGSTRLIKEDVEIQKIVIDMINSGISISACKACATNIGSVEIMEKIGIDVKYMGEPLTDIIKKGKKLITL